MKLAVTWIVLCCVVAGKGDEEPSFTHRLYSNVRSLFQWVGAVFGVGNDSGGDEGKTSKMNMLGIMVVHVLLLSVVHSSAPAGLITKAVALIQGDSGKGSAIGTVVFTLQGDSLVVTGKVSGLSPGNHGFHVHQYGDHSDGCNSAGPHFNPEGKDHGAPADDVRHVGDFGNIEVGDDGVANISYTDKLAKLEGKHSIIGRSLLIHAKADDLGKGGDAESKKTGNAGARIACGIIGLAAA